MRPRQIVLAAQGWVTPPRAGIPPWEHLFVMSVKGSPYARFRRALATGNAQIAWTAAHELDRVSLEDALAVVLLQVDEDRYGRAAARWLGRLLVEAPGQTLGDAQLAAAALAAVPAPAALEALRAVCEGAGLPAAAAAVQAHVDARRAGPPNSVSSASTRQLQPSAHAKH